ncbi:cytochrome P450 [Guyanagaster necrorhizus]|uniref:Cytochrome P450 n=1 Tax=Guyanagaster necrorhizus TaxID=856835 RepID=A0A9P7VF90_9AGAR|nr:cytochrome P450 [Guyanagaster necrorhizus MCA 3950]KAG7439465.1 cytochrome P450 [Guyanagaster necrorhizus MCA 3950]
MSANTLMFLPVDEFASLILGSLLILLFVLFRYKVSSLPPGSSGGLFGCKVPQFQPWKTFYEWNKQYGPVVSFRLGTKRVIVLGTVKAATDLLVVRGNIYSGRPRSIVASIIPLASVPIPYSQETCRHEIYSGVMRGMSDGPQYRKWKTLMQSGPSNTAALNYQRLQSIESFLLLRYLLQDEDPLQYKDRLRRFAISIVCCVAYGRRIKILDHEIVVNNVKTGIYFGKISVPGKFLVDLWPVLLYLPKFLQWFRWVPERRRAVDTKMYLSLLDDLKHQMQVGTAHTSVDTHGLEKQEQFGLTDVETAYALSAPWAAGTGTTMATIEVFLCAEHPYEFMTVSTKDETRSTVAMQLYPAAMKKPQAEIDSVIGSGRMPDFKDFDALPYVQAVIKELMRHVFLVFFSTRYDETKVALHRTYRRPTRCDRRQCV